MPTKKDKHLIVGLDIGTSKVVAMVGICAPGKDVEVIGFGMHPCRGLKKGIVADIESTAQSIQRAVEEAELFTGCQIRSAYIGISGSHMRSVTSQGTVVLGNRVVTKADIDRVIESTSQIVVPDDQEIIHILPQQYRVDQQDGIINPIDLSGKTLMARVQVITGAKNAISDIHRCVQRCDLDIDGLILQPLASSHAVLTIDEKQMGVCLADIGAGTTDIAVFTEGAIKHTAVIPVAGTHVTNDISVAFSTPKRFAEELKIKQGCALAKRMRIDELIEVPSVGNRPPRSLERRTLTEVVQPRYEELFNLILAELQRSGFEEMCASGIVLTGGSSSIEGSVELAEAVFQMPVRVGLPKHIDGLVDIVQNPRYATSVGLLIYAHEQLGDRKITRVSSASHKRWFDYFKLHFLFDKSEKSENSHSSFS